MGGRVPEVCWVCDLIMTTIPEISAIANRQTKLMPAIAPPLSPLSSSFGAGAGPPLESPTGSGTAVGGGGVSGYVAPGGSGGELGECVGEGELGAGVGAGELGLMQYRSPLPEP